MTILASARAGETPQRLANTDWLHHRLTISGPGEMVAAFSIAARGAGIIPWQLDLERIEEDLFHRLIAPPRQRGGLGLAGARALARQLREAVEVRHQAAVARVGVGQACPLDLYKLVPVPAGILCLGPDDPVALAWLWQHWGTTETLRHVSVEPARARHTTLLDATASLRITFWSADWTPWRALATLIQRWPALHFHVRPSYDQT